RALFPGDFVLQAAGGYYYQESGRYAQALDCRSAALALRPGDIGIRIKVAESLTFDGRLAEAATTLRICLAADPANVEANYLLGCTQSLLGDLAGSLASLSRAPEIAADVNMSIDLAVAQYLTGLLTREQIERR